MSHTGRQVQGEIKILAGMLILGWLLSTAHPALSQAAAATRTPRPTQNNTITRTPTPAHGTNTVTGTPDAPLTPTSPWTTPANFSLQPDTFSDIPLLLCDRYQNIHAFWLERESARSLIFYRTDQGGAFSQPNDILVTHDGTELSGFISSQNEAYLLWTNYVNGSLFFSHAALSAAGSPLAWSTPITIASAVDSGTIAEDAEGNLHILYFASSSEALTHEIYHLTSSDMGSNWSLPTIVYTEDTSVAAAGNVMAVSDLTGRLHLVWQVRSYSYGVLSEVMYSRSQDQGLSWSNPLLLAKSDTRPGVAAPAVFTFGNNEVHLTYDTPDRMHQWSSDGGATWSKPDLIMDLNGAAFGGFNQLVKDSMGTLHAVGAVGNGVFSSTFDRTKWTTPEAIDRREYDPHHQQMVACQGDILTVIYDDRRGENEIWYSSRTVVGSHISQQPIPVPTQTTTALPQNTPGDSSHSVSPTPTKWSPGSPNEAGATAISASLAPIGIALIPVVGIVLLAMILYRLRFLR